MKTHTIFNFSFYQLPTTNAELCLKDLNQVDSNCNFSRHQQVLLTKLLMSSYYKLWYFQLYQIWNAWCCLLMIKISWKWIDDGIKISVNNWIKIKSTSNSHSLIIGLVSFMVRSASGSYRSWKCSLAFGIYGFINLTMRLLAIVDFYIPSLGMLDVLRHLQADRIPFTNPILSKGYHNTPK